MLGSYAFSPFGYSGSYAGFGDTEEARTNTAVKYRLNYMNFRAAGLVQWGGYDQGNGMSSLYEGQIGGDFNLFGGKLSLDGISGYATNVVNVGTFAGSCAVLNSGPFAGQTGCSDGVPRFYDNTDVTATLSNNTGLWLLGKYALPSIPLTISGGYGWWRRANPSDDYLNGFKTIGGWNIQATIPRPFRTPRNFGRPSGPPLTPITTTGSLASSLSARNTRSIPSST